MSDLAADLPDDVTASISPGKEHAFPRMDGRRIGPYQIHREIGRGGMGVVYLGSRSDGVFYRHVVIKIVRPSVQDADASRRFRREREILAALDHPNIARLFDGGNTEEGLPYFVMEYVQGQPIDAWCNQQKLNVSQRLELFRTVCTAVQYAHQHLIVHRDLKPSNILVTADGVVKLLDFGIAKLLQAPEEGSGASETVTILQAMTPAYASPEQVRGLRIGTPSDVYSLGVVLYELMTGHRPYRLHSRVLHEMMRAVCEEEPAAPSAIVMQTELLDGMDGSAITPEDVSATREGSPARLRRRLEGDLDNILLTALRKEPTRRYSTVDQFDADLSRHIEGLPVSACKDTLNYRLRKFLRRNRAGAAAAGFAIATLFAGLMTNLWQERLALKGQRQSLLLPQLVLDNYMTLVLLAVVIYFSRATLRRVLGALAGATVFAFFFIGQARMAYSLGWWHEALSNPPSLPMVLFAVDLFSYAPILALIGWRITRRSGWRGQVGFIAAMGIFGPVRDAVGAALTGAIRIRSDFLPLIGWGALWACNIALMQGVMRLVAGAARSDALARQPKARCRVPRYKPGTRP